MSFKEVSTSRSFNGYQKVLQHESTVLKCAMNFGIYLPESDPIEKLPTLFYLSGLTCTEANFIEKSGFQRFASQHRIIVINIDTSPRNKCLQNEDGDDLKPGPGAGYYLDATEPKWVEHNYFMYSYFIKEFVPFVFKEFPIDQNKCGIFGHRALTIGLKNPSIFKSISSFAGICNPIKVDLWRAAFKILLGDDEAKWTDYDAVELAKVYAGPKRRILLDQGGGDEYYHKKHLLPENLVEGINIPNIEWDFRLREDYNHGYFYIHTFIHEHFEHFLEQIKN